MCLRRCPALWEQWKTDIYLDGYKDCDTIRDETAREECESNTTWNQFQNFMSQFGEQAMFGACSIPMGKSPAHVLMSALELGRPTQLIEDCNDEFIKSFYEDVHNNVYGKERARTSKDLKFIGHKYDVCSTMTKGVEGVATDAWDGIATGFKQLGREAAEGLTKAGCYGITAAAELDSAGCNDIDGGVEPPQITPNPWEHIYKQENHLIWANDYNKCAGFAHGGDESSPGVEENALIPIYVYQKQ